ncbi:helix-turn-helix domain-containing protein [Halostella sp. PRR32]|uniref:helix-turn-helix domain-containing protein n=1 Tax=Halostella sp. PRR32 TaxID=3098147 RepID=UPI002B1D27F4|nr:helix-turn-helix domain-containing protein [Halostella sp. PRR32]
MTNDQWGESSKSVSPDEAFAILGDETRLHILETLREADELLSFSELYERVNYDDYSNFDYHLEKLTGLFVRKTGEGYGLRGAGRRIVAAVLSGTVGEDLLVEPTLIDEQCPFCSAPVEVGFQQEHVELYCSECPGVVRDANSKGKFFDDYGILSQFSLPPAGVRDRTPREVLAAAWTWGHLDILADSTGVCSRCSASIEYSVTVCEDHDPAEGYCEQCGRRYAARFDVHCRNCHYSVKGIAIARLLANTELLAFLTTHGINPVAPKALGRALATIGNYEEEILSTDPFEARFTFATNGDAITLTVSEQVAVTDVTRHDASESGY